MKYLSLKQPVHVHGRLVYPEDGVLQLDDANEADKAEAERILAADQAVDVTDEFAAAAAPATEA